MTDWLMDDPDSSGKIGPPVDAVICREPDCDFWLGCDREQSIDVLSAHAVSEHPTATDLKGWWMAAASFRTFEQEPLDLGIVRA